MSTPKGSEASAALPSYRKWILAGLCVLVLALVYLLVRSRMAEIPEELLPAPVPSVRAEDEGTKSVRGWLEKAAPEEGRQYAEGEVDPALKDVKLEPQTMHQGSRQEEEKPEQLPQPLAAVLAAVQKPFRNTFDRYPSFALNASFVLMGSEAEMGETKTTGTVFFEKDSQKNWHAKYDVLSEGGNLTYNQPLYQTEFWLFGEKGYIRRPGAEPQEVTENSPAEDQELFRQVMANSIDLLSHDMLRRWVTEAKVVAGYSEPQVGRHEQRPVDQYTVIASHYGENPNFVPSARAGTIWIDREHQLPLKADLYYAGRITIPSGRVRVYQASQRVTLEITRIGMISGLKPPAVKH